MRPARFFVGSMALVIFGFFVPHLAAQGPAGTWITDIYCQNLSLTSAANITIAFYAENNATAVLTYNDPTPIPAGSVRNYFTPSAPPGLPSPFLGSAVVTSDQPVGCNVNPQQVVTGGSGDPYRMGAYTGVFPEDSAPTIYVPQVERQYYGWNSYMAIQNTESTSTGITIRYKDRFGGDLPAANETFTIPAQSVKIFYQNSNTNLPLGANGFVGAAKISADDNIAKLAVVVAFHNAGSDSTTSQFQAYNGFKAGANKLLVPRFVRKFYGYNGGISIQNVGASPTTVTVTFYPKGGGSFSFITPSIAAGAAYPFYAPSIAEFAPVDALPMSGRVGNAVLQAAPGGSIVANINEDNRGDATANDNAVVPSERISQGYTYNAVPDGAQTNNLFFPQITKKVGTLISGGYQISNTTGSAGTCNITFPGAPAANIVGQALAANGSISTYSHSIAALPDGFNSSVHVSCTQPVIGIANFSVIIPSGKFGDSLGQSNAINR